MKIAVFINITAQDARCLFEKVDEENRKTPRGEALRGWVANYAANTVASTWQYDAGVFPQVSSEVLEA